MDVNRGKIVKKYFLTHGKLTFKIVDDFIK